MRVLLVSHVAPPHIGGVESIVQMEAEAFRDAGHEVVWVTSNATGKGSAVPEGERLRVVRQWAWHLPERLFGIAYPLFLPSLAWRLWREVGRADLVHVHGLAFPGSPIAVLFARLRGKRSLCTDHGGMLRYPSRLANVLLSTLMLTAGRLTARCADKLIALNHDVEGLLVRLGGRHKVQLLANPVDVVMFQPPTPEQRTAARAVLGWDHRPRVLCVSRLLPHKGIDVLLAARDDTFELVFCGPGDEAMRQRIRDAGAECLDARPREQVLALYHAADAFALPSHNEGFPVVIQEALACGLPVVSSDLPAYAAYRNTPGLHLCEPTPERVRRELLRVLAAPSTAPRQPIECGRKRWLDELCQPLATSATTDGHEATTRFSKTRTLLLALLVAHLLLGIARLPGKVYGRRSEEIDDYRRVGAARFLLDSAHLGGAEQIEWLLANTAEDAVVLWRWPADGALEFAAALLAPRLVVDERNVPAGATTFAGRSLARGTAPDGAQGMIVLQGTDDGGLSLTARER